MSTPPTLAFRLLSSLSKMRGRQASADCFAVCSSSIDAGLDAGPVRNSRSVDLTLLRVCLIVSVTDSEELGLTIRILV